MDSSVFNEALTFAVPRTSFKSKPYTLRAPAPRPSVQIEHSTGQFCACDGELWEQFEVVSTLSGEWERDFEWRQCK